MTIVIWRRQTGVFWREEIWMSIRSRIAAIRGLFARSEMAEAVLVISLAVIIGIVIYITLSGELANMIDTTTPYAPGS